MKIGIDFDDVVANSGAAIIENYNKNHGTHFKKDDFHSYFEETWNITPAERINEIDTFFATAQLKNISPIAGSLKAIQTLKEKGNDIYVVTGRADKDIEQTEAWIKHYLPSFFKGIHYASSRNKSEVCKELGIEVFIDDSPSVALDCANAGIGVLLFDQPWNRKDTFPKNVQRVTSWDEIIEKLV